MSINDNFNSVYVIYIPKREEYIRNVFKEMNIKAKFIPAVLIEDLPSLDELLKQKLISKFFLYKNLKNEGYPCDLVKLEKSTDKKLKDWLRSLKGKLALQLSYLKIFNEFLDTKDDNCIIFEDDILYPKDLNLLNKRFNSIFKKELENIEWDYINLGRCYDICEINTQFSENLIIDSYPLCTHACCYSRKVSETLIATSIPLKYPGDHINLNFFYLNPKFKCFTAKPALFYQNHITLSSTLGNSNKELPECGISKKK
jgi:hypothetical protein